MAQREDPPHVGVIAPLKQAILVFSDTEDLDEYERAVAAALGKRAWSANPDISDPATVARARSDTRLVSERNHASRMLRLEFIKKLKRGELAAVGYVEPVAINSEQVEIPADKWNLLAPDFGNSKAVGAGLSISGVRVFVPAPGRDATLYRTGEPGRPGSSHLVKREFQRQVEAGVILPTLREQSEDLANWLSEKHPDAHPIKPRTVENAIRSAYNAHRPKPRKAPTK